MLLKRYFWDLSPVQGQICTQWVPAQAAMGHGELAAQWTWIRFQLLNRSRDTRKYKNTSLLLLSPQNRTTREQNYNSGCRHNTLQKVFYTVKVLGNPGAAKPFHLGFRERFSLSSLFLCTTAYICVWFATLGHVFYFPGCHIH